MSIPKPGENNIVTQDPPISRLYNGLKEDGRYTKSFDEFKSQYSTPEQIERLYTGLKEDGDYTKSIDDFKSQYFNPVKKKVGSLDLSNLDAGGGTNISLATSPSESISTEETPVEMAIKAEALARKTTPVYNENTGITTKAGEKVISYNKPDATAMAESNKINEELKADGYNPKKLVQDFKDIPQNIFSSSPEFDKKTLLNDYKENPSLYERKIATIKAQTKLKAALTDIPEGDKVWHEVMNSYNNSDVGDFSNRRQNVRRLTNIVNEYGGEESENILKNIGTDFANIYAEAATNPEQLYSDPNHSLNSNQKVAYNWLQDTNPSKAKETQAALLSDADIKDNPEAQIQKQEAGKRLEEIGIGLQQNYAMEKKIPLLKQYQYLYDKAQSGELSPEEQQKMAEISIEGTKYDNILENVSKDSQNIPGNYPKAAYLDANNFAQELADPKHTGLDWLGIEAGKATSNTVSGLSELVKTPFLSDRERQINQAEILGSDALSNNSAYLKQENQTTKTFKPTLSKELEADIETIKNDPDISKIEKRNQITDLLLHRNGEWSRTGIEGGQTNINIASLMYGVGGLAANLAPFMAAELLTGGGATAGTVRKLTSTFASAAATGFHDSYVEALKKGSTDPYGEAMRVTAINSAAMAGASTPEAIKKMLGAESGAISKLISGMTDDEIKLALKSEPKALGAFRKSLNAVKQAGSNVASSAAEGFKGGAKITAFTTAGQMVNDAISGEVKPLQDYGKQALIETLKFGIFGTALGTLSKGMKKPTDISMAALSEFGKDPESGFRALDVMQKDGSISPTDAVQVKANIEKASKIFKSSPILNNSDLSPNAKREYLYNKMVENNAKESAAALPPKQAAEAEQTAIVAVHKNQILLDQPTEKQLEKRKVEVERSLEPEVDESGKKKEINEKVKRDATAELQAIKEIQENHAAMVADAAAKRLSKKEENTKPSIPIEETDEQGIPVGDNVPEATSYKEVKKEFPNTKIVDEKGDPLKVYHGSVDNFNEFDLDKTFSGNIGIHFGTTESAKDRINSLADDNKIKQGDSWNLMSGYLDIKNPLRIEDGFGDEKNFIHTLLHSESNIKKEDLDYLEAEKNKEQTDPKHLRKIILDVLKRNGYDGIVYKNNIEGGGKDSYVIFDKSQFLLDNKSQKSFGVSKDEISESETPFKNSILQTPLYHGSKKDFNEFQPTEKGVYFTSRPEYTNAYMAGDGGNFSKDAKRYEAYLDIKNPLKLIFDTSNADALNDAAAKAKKDGYDSVILTDKNSGDIIEALVFEKDQIKIKSKSSPSNKEVSEQQRLNNEFDEFEKKSKASTNENKGKNIIAKEKTSPTAVESTENIQSPKEEQGEQPKGAKDIQDEDGVILSHKGLQEVATEFGLADVTPRENITDAKEFEDAGKTIDKWVEEKNYSKNIEGLTKKAEDGDALNFQERVILQQHLANERARVSSIREEKGINSPEYDKALKELNRLKEAGETARSTAGAALRVGETRSFAKPTVEDWMTERMESAGVEELTEKQKEETQKQFEEYEAASKMADAKMEEMQNEISKLKAELEVSKNKKGLIRKKNQEYLKTERQDIIAEMKEKLANINKGDNTLSSDIPYRKQLVVIVPSVLKLTRNLVETGVSKLGDIVDNIHEQIKDLVPGIQKKDVRDIIAGEYTEQKETKSSLQRQLEDVRDEAKLIKRLEDLRNNEPTTERAKRNRNAEITKLQEQIKDFKKEKADVEAAQKRITELQAELDRIKNREDKPEKDDVAPRREKIQEEKELGAQIAEEKAKWKNELKTSPEDAAILSAKKRNESITKKIEDKIANGDFTTEKKVPFDENKALRQANPKLFNEAMDAIIKKDEAKEKFDLAKRKDELSKRSKLVKATDFAGKIFSTAKAIKAGIDDSVTFAQLGLAVLANPKSALKAKFEAVRDINNTRFKRQLAALHNSPIWNTIKGSGLDITEPKSLDKEKVEELYSGNLLDNKIGGKVNLWTNTGGLFERLFTSMGNNMRLNMFVKQMEYLENKGITFDTHPQEYKDMARDINELTGRGKINEHLQTAMPVISPIIWAPKMLSSTLNLLGISDLAYAPFGKKGLYRTITPEARKYAMTQMGKGIGMGVSVMTALAIAGWSVDKDPTSATFGNVKHGTKSYNVFGRYAGLAKVLIQLATGKKTTQKGEVDLDAKGGRGKVLGKFLRGKMTPIAGEIYDYWLNSKQNSFTGKKITLGGLPDDLLTPISVGDLKKGFEQDGSSSLLTRFLPAFEGINVTDERDFTKKIDDNLEDLLDRNKISSAQDTNEFINYNDGRRKITKEESESYKKLRDEKVDKGIRQLFNKGYVVSDAKGTPSLKPYLKLTPEEVAKATTQIKKDATEDSKKELFGFKSKREEALERISAKRRKNLNKKLGLE